MQTVYEKEEKSDVLIFPFSSLDDRSMLSFEIRGQHPERSYEDRSVYVSVTSSNTEPEISMDGMEVTPALHMRPDDFSFWLNGEDAIELGMKFIEHGKFALEANMIQHQSIHVGRQFQTYLQEDRIEEVIFKMVDDAPVGYGEGYKLFHITPTWNEGMAPEYNEDFVYKKVIYWSPFEEEYQDQLDFYTNGCSYSFEGYDHDREVVRFHERLRLMSGDF